MIVIRKKIGEKLDEKIKKDGLRCEEVVEGKNKGGDEEVIKIFKERDRVRERIVENGDGERNNEIGKKKGKSIEIIVEGGNKEGKRIGDRRNIIRRIERKEKK